MTQSAKTKKMFATIKGHKVKLGSQIVINTGGGNRSVKLMERHMGQPSQVCVQRNGKKFLVPKSKVVF